MHVEPVSKRYSNDLDYFHDTEERVATAFEADRRVLEAAGYELRVVMHQPGFIRGIVSLQTESTKIDWAHDTAWRFMPPIKHPSVGFLLHPVDLAINKLLALVGRDEPRDFLDILEVHASVLSLGALCWAAAGKDPGFTPMALLNLLRRRGHYRPEDFAKLHLVEQPNLPELKTAWLGALDQTEAFITKRPPSELGCLYYSRKLSTFVSDFEPGDPEVVPHYGRPGGLIPKVGEG